MLITILTPTYNRSHTLPRLYNSLERQTCKDFNWLIVDDGSTDNTREIVDIFKEKTSMTIDYLLKENGGKHTAINEGVDLVKTKLIFIVDSDDYLTDDAVKTIYVTDKIGSEYVVPLLGVWDDFSDIDFSALPEQFVLKCSHDCGSIVICRDKKTFDYDAARKKLTLCLKRNYYWESREWPYKNIPSKIIGEEYLDSGDGKPPVDYKFYCFDGEPKVMLITTDRGKDTMAYTRFVGHTVVR
jgi:glycosyltransferase involved in cell wall biosynthesis